MKSHWLSALVVLSLALVVKAKEEETDHLQVLQQGRQVDAATDAVADVANTVTGTVSDALGSVSTIDPFNQFLLLIGNFMGLINDIDLTDGGLLKPAALGAGAAAAGAAGTAAVTTISTIKTAVLSLLLKPLDFVNGILAIVGLVLLIIYLISSEGDIGGLVDTGFLRRESDNFVYDSYSNYVNTARDLLGKPSFQQLTADVLDAFTKNY